MAHIDRILEMESGVGITEEGGNSRCYPGHDGYLSFLLPEPVSPSQSVPTLMTPLHVLNNSMIHLIYHIILYQSVLLLRV